MRGVEEDEAVMVSLLAGFPDRVARRRAEKKAAVLLAGGGAGELAASSVVREPMLMLALEAEQQGRGVLVRMASAIEAEWLLDLQPDAMTTSESLELDGGRVVKVSRLMYDALVLEESRTPAEASVDSARLLVRHALSKGLGALDAELPAQLAALRARVDFARAAAPEVGLGAVDDAAVETALAELAGGTLSLAGLDARAVMAALQAGLDTRALARLAPESLELPGGRRVRVNYAEGQPPWIESRLQDFFGLAEGPRIGGGRTPVVIHLLAPNQRAVQVTTDLAGFWQRHYPALRRELGRRYPRHSWPEDPLTASPPAPHTRRR